MQIRERKDQKLCVTRTLTSACSGASNGESSPVGVPPQIYGLADVPAYVETRVSIGSGINDVEGKPGSRGPSRTKMSNPGGDRHSVESGIR